MLNKDYAIMEQKEKKVTIEVTKYEAGRIYQLLKEKGRNFTNAKLPSIAKHYYRLAENILKQIDTCVYKD